MLSDAEISFTAEMVRASGLKVKSVHGTNGRNPISEVQRRKDRRVGRETRRDRPPATITMQQDGAESCSPALISQITILVSHVKIGGIDS